MNMFSIFLTSQLQVKAAENEMGFEARLKGEEILPIEADKPEEAAESEEEDVNTGDEDPPSKPDSQNPKKNKKKKSKNAQTKTQSVSSQSQVAAAPPIDMNFGNTDDWPGLTSDWDCTDDWTAVAPSTGASASAGASVDASASAGASVDASAGAGATLTLDASGSDEAPMDSVDSTKNTEAGENPNDKSDSNAAKTVPLSYSETVKASSDSTNAAVITQAAQAGDVTTIVVTKDGMEVVESDEAKDNQDTQGETK